MLKEFTKDNLKVKIFAARSEMGICSANDVKNAVLKLLNEKDEIRMIFAAAPSQNDFLEAFTSDKDIDFTRINAFHMDEYIGLDKNAPQGFGNFLRDRLFSKVPFKSVTYLDGQCENPDAECKRYAELLAASPIDIVCMGIGENGHIAFNDPPVADFNDPLAVKVVKLDEICRNQQVNDGCFDSIDSVPTHALSLTIPRLIDTENIFCIVPAPTKANAVKATLTGDITTACPASILRRHANATLYLDADSAKYII